MGNREKLIKGLDVITDRVAEKVIKNVKQPVVTKKPIRIGKLLIERNLNGLFDISGSDKKLIYKDIFNFDIATIIAERHVMGERSILTEILGLEEKYSKHFLDMRYYLHCFKSMKKQNDIKRMAILEDKFQVSEFLAKQAKERILIFKRMK